MPGLLRRLGVSVLVVVTVFAMVMTNMPESDFEDATDRQVRAYVQAVGLDQSWGVFAPNPRRVSRGMYAVVGLDDGREVRWDMPAWDPVVGSYRNYRWRKWMTRVVLDRYEHRLWEPAARWIARQHDDLGAAVTSVELIRTFRDVPPPGEPTPQEWDEFSFYTLEVTP